LVLSPRFVRNLPALKAIDAVGRAYGVRPSAILGIQPEDEWLAYQLDVVTVAAGLGQFDSPDDKAGKPASSSGSPKFSPLKSLPQVPGRIVRTITARD
jgi:hypothetical protein